ncbi:MAG: cupin domain-containing protein [Rhodobacteraceae bacterium]|nr:cupin domain-containing protein [Paracoccaceae bacterium]
MTDDTPAMRRIVTGNDASGRSRILSDARTPHVIRSGPGRALIDMWSTHALGPDLSVEDGADRHLRLEPPEGGTVFRVFQLAPRAGNSDPDDAERSAAEAFARMEASHLRVDTTRHPGMHKSPTLDYIMLLRGRVKMLLDDDETVLEPFDVVIQRGTNHAWVNLSDEPALLMAVLMDADRGTD